MLSYGGQIHWPDVFVVQTKISTNPGKLFSGQHIKHAVTSDAAADSDDSGAMLVHRSGLRGASRNTV